MRAWGKAWMGFFLLSVGASTLAFLMLMGDVRQEDTLSWKTPKTASVSPIAVIEEGLTPDIKKRELIPDLVTEEEIVSANTTQASADLIWQEFLTQVDAVVHQKGSRAFHPRESENVISVMESFRHSSKMPSCLPDPRGEVLAATGWSLSTLVTLTGWEGFPGWRSWVDELLLQSKEKTWIEIGALRAYLGEVGEVDLDELYRFPVRYQFLGGGASACSAEVDLELASRILSSFSLETEEDWTLRSLAALCLSGSYEEQEFVRQALKAPLFQVTPWDLCAHAGALLGMGVFGGELAAESVDELLEKEDYFGQAMLTAWCGSLLKKNQAPSLAYQIARGWSRRARAQSTQNTLEALRTFDEEGRQDFELLDLLLERALDPEDQAVRRPILIHKLLMEGLEGTTGVFLVEELAFQDPEHTAFLFMAAHNLRQRDAVQEEALFLESLNQLEQLYAEVPFALRDIRSAQAYLARDAPPEL